MAEFREKHGPENLSRFDGAQSSLSDCLAEVSAAPFIAEKRLVVIEGMPPFTKEDMQRILDEVHPQVILVIADPKPDKRLSSTKAVLQAATLKEFSPLQGEPLRQWMRTVFRARQAQADEQVITSLLESAGEDQQILLQEMEKLILHAAGRPITREDIELLVLPSSERSVWRMMDLLGEGRSQDAVAYARSLILRGESPYSIWNMLLWMLASLTQVTAALESKVTAPLAIVQATGVKFGSVRALLPLARRCQSAKLTPILEQVVAADIGLKTGAFRTTNDNEEELEALIDRCLLAFS